MLKNKLAVAALGALASVVAVGAATAPAPATTASDVPCAPVLNAPRPPKETKVPAAPTGVRIIRGSGGAEPDAIEELEQEIPGSGPFVPDGSEAEAAAEAAITHPYFDMLSLRPDCQVAYDMRSQAQLDAIETRGKSEKKLPVTYDAVNDSALFRMYAPVSTDSQQKLMPFTVPSGSVLLTWDFRFDENFKWRKAGDTATHKTWRIDDSDVPWLAMKTDYQRATNQNRGIAEFYMSVPSNKFIPPGTTRGSREIPEPKLGEFFIEANTWTRAWVLIEGIGQPTVKVSVWVADTTRGPVQLFDRLNLYPPGTGLAKADFRFEYDTSMDHALNPVEMHSWNRNFVVLKDPASSSIAALLQRPR